VSLHMVFLPWLRCFVAGRFLHRHVARFECGFAFLPFFSFWLAVRFLLLYFARPFGGRIGASLLSAFSSAENFIVSFGAGFFVSFSSVWPFSPNQDI